MRSSTCSLLPHVSDVLSDDPGPGEKECRCCARNLRYPSHSCRGVSHPLEESIELADAHNKLYCELIELLITVAALCQCLYIKGCLFQLAGVLRAISAQQPSIGLVTTVKVVQKPLDLRVSVEALHFRLEHIIGAHAAQGEVPHALFVLGAVGVSVEVVRAIVVLIFQQLDEEEHALDVLGSKADVLVEARPALVVEVDVEELARVQRLRHSMDEIQACHIF